MKYIKANLDVVICAAVALIAIGLCFWPTMGWAGAEQDDLAARIKSVNTAKALIGSVEVIPGSKPLANATIEDNIIDANKSATKHMKEMAEEVAKLAASQNQKGRVITPRGSDHEIPLLPLLVRGEKVQEDNFLPAIVQHADPVNFRSGYEQLFQQWVQQMNGGTPPTANEITARIAERLKEIRHEEGETARVAGGTNLSGPSQLPVREQNKIKHDAVVEHALKIHIYVDENALQKRPWYGKPVSPNEAEIFEALVDSWLQQDVVAAIVSLNDKVLDKQTQADAKNVGHSPIKRLESIVIGSAALGASGNAANSLFMASTSGSNPGAPPVAAAGVAGTDKSRSLTGHVRSADSSGGYDVVPMKIVVDIDPAYQNQFIDALYRQNNGYTVLNWNIRAVDPLEAASNGYLYGTTQVVRMEILVEALMFRSWTVPLMPPAIRAQAEIPAAGPTPPSR